MAEDLPGKLGYDRTIVVFSPDGRLFQVEYAKETVKLGSTALGLVYKNGVALAATKQKGPLAVSREDEKVQELDSHIAATFAGLTADARTLIERARVKGQIYRITYDEQIDVSSLVRFIGDMKQSHTQYAGLRPVGISFLIGGFDGEPSLYETDPGGTVFEWTAQAIGRGTEIARKVLEDEWKPGMTKDEALSLALKALKKAEKRVEVDTLEVVTIDPNGQKRLSPAEREKLIQ